MAQFMLISALVATYMCIVQGRDPGYITFPTNQVEVYGRNSNESPCNSPNGGRGSCISLYDCSPFLSIVNKPNKSQKDIEVLRQAQCGFQGQTPKVCCPSNEPAPPLPTDTTCFTPDAKQGTCTGLYSCPHLANLLKPPVSKDTIAFVQSSRCEGSEKYSVCCGQPPPDFNYQPGPNAVCESIVAPPDPRTGCCGVESLSSDRIYGGEATALDQYPWIVIIEYIQGSKIKLLCGGALISGRYVVTAGHCVLGEVLDVGTPRNVRLGEYDISNDVKDRDCVPTAGGGRDCSSGVTVIGIEKIIPHPQYNPKHHLKRHDIALLRLKQLAPYNDFIRPICLPQTDVTQSPPPDFLMYVAGWGAVNETHSKSQAKQHVDVPFLSKEECQPQYSLPRRNVALWSGQLCAGGVKGKDSCKGDSGGPLMWENGKSFELIGIVSFGPSPCGMENVPGVYTKVYEYLPWIRSNIKP